MANFGQATFVGSDVVIRCDKGWTCCQREQAKAKTENLNAGCPLTIKSKVSKTSKRAKKNCQSRETNRFLNEMEADPKKGAADNASSPCLAEQLQRDWNGGSRSTSELDVQMDHPVEAKLGGPANTALKALDTQVNNFFGGVAKNLGNKMRKAGHTEIASLSLVCPPPCKPPKAADTNTDYSCGKRTTYPKKTTAAVATPVHA